MKSTRQALLAYALATRDEPPGDPDAFRRLVGPQGALAGVTATCFLLSAGDFLDRVIPRLLAQLDRETHPQRVVLRGRARGSVDWGGTIKARCGGSQDPTIFVCRQSWRLYDLPENQLVKYLLDRLRRYQERVPRKIRRWVWSAPGERRARDGVLVDDQVSYLAHRLRRFAKNAYLRDVELPPAIGSEHLQAARNSRNRFYNETAAFYERYVDSVESPSWGPWRRMLRRHASLLPRGEARVLAEVMARPHAAETRGSAS